MKKVSELPGVGVAVSSLVLRSVEFVRLEVSEERASAEPAMASHVPLSLGFRIGIGRPSRSALNVELEATIAAVPHAQMKIAYVVQFTRELVAEPEETENRFWRDVVSQVAPVVIYPYLRETVASLTGKAGLTPVILPILNFKTVIDPATIEIPPAPIPELFDQVAEA